MDKDLLEYPPEFWKRAIELAMTHSKECEKCHFPEGWKDPDAIKGKPLIVRVALRDGEKFFPGNLGLFCTRCRRGKYQVSVKRKDLDKLILPLFEDPQ